MKRFTQYFIMAIFAVMAISSCGGNAVAPSPASDTGANQSTVKRVVITAKTPSQKPDVNPWCVGLRHRSIEQIEWAVAPPNLDFTIRFDKNGSPFESDEFDNEHNMSGPVVVELNEDEKYRTYEYSVDVEGFPIHDPVVIIRK